jgi:hypothetical protein
MGGKGSKVYPPGHEGMKQGSKKDAPLKVLFVGPSNSGKTILAQHLSQYLVTWGKRRQTKDQMWQSIMESIGHLVDEYFTPNTDENRRFIDEVIKVYPELHTLLADINANRVPPTATPSRSWVGEFTRLWRTCAPFRNRYFALEPFNCPNLPYFVEKLGSMDSPLDPTWSWLASPDTLFRLYKPSKGTDLPSRIQFNVDLNSRNVQLIDTGSGARGQERDTLVKCFTTLKQKYDLVIFTFPLGIRTLPDGTSSLKDALDFLNTIATGTSFPAECPFLVLFTKPDHLQTQISNGKSISSVWPEFRGTTLQDSIQFISSLIKISGRPALTFTCNLLDSNLHLLYSIIKQSLMMNGLLNFDGIREAGHLIFREPLFPVKKCCILIFWCQTQNPKMVVPKEIFLKIF